MKAKVVLLATKQTTVMRGHPWVFPKAIARTEGSLLTGALIEVYSAEGEFLGVGVYNEHSLYRVRILALSHELKNGLKGEFSSLISYRLNQAYQLRTLLNLPNNETNAYRLFNSEADGLSGLTIDRFNNFSVVASSAYWVEEHKELIYNALQQLVPQDQILWMPQIKPLSQDGWHSVESFGGHDKAQIQEGGVHFQVEFSRAQKTGLFIDQRENHQRVAALAAGKKVLDLYTYSGGFALHAAKAGALKVTAVDSSSHAIEQAKNNALLNQLSTVDFIEADARDYLVHAGDYDLVVLDPPKLVPSQKHIQRAKNYYRFLHREVFKYMRAGSLLMTCNCSSALSTQEFSTLVSTQALMVGKQARTLGVYGPAACHPTLAAFPEGSYLTALLIGVV
jgi:23S rRNA (cytosine1962-C5)-methyltransferase